MAEVERVSANPVLDRNKATAWLLLILVLCFCVYAQSWGNHFALDGRLIAKAQTKDGQRNSMIVELRSLPEYFRANYWQGRGRIDRLYRPVTILSYAVTHAVFGGVSVAEEASPHHLINILLQLMAVWLVYRLLRDIGAGRFASLLAALLFALHAIHSEVVAGIVGRAELFGFCFGAGALLLALGCTTKRGARRVVQAALSLFFFFLAFCSKENALAWAPFLVVWLFAKNWLATKKPEGLSFMARTWTVLLPFVAVLAWYYCRSVMYENVGVPEKVQVYYLANPIFSVDTTSRISTAITVWAYGVYKTLFPFSLTGDYGPPVLPVIESLSDIRFLLSALLMSGILVMGLLYARKSPLCFLAMSCFLGFSFLTSNILFPIGTLFAERLYFTPSLGLSFLVAALASRYRFGRLACACLACWLLACAFVILQRNPVWKDTETFYISEGERESASASLILNASEAYRRVNDEKRWIQLLKRAVTVLPGYVEAWYNLGLYHIDKKEYAKAKPAFESALLSPRFQEAQATMRGRVHLNMAYVLVLRREVDGAKKHAMSVIETDIDTIVTDLDAFMHEAITVLDSTWLAMLLRKGEQRLPTNSGWPFWQTVLATRANNSLAASAQMDLVLRRSDLGNIVRRIVRLHSHAKKDAFALFAILLEKYPDSKQLRDWHEALKKY